MNGAIILAAGRGRRMQADRNKQYLPLAGHPVLYYSMQAFAAAACIDGVLVVVHPDEGAEAERTAQEAGLIPKLEGIIPGGAERQDSVFAALAAAPAKWQKVLIHDGARPLVSQKLIADVLAGIKPGLGIIPGVPVRDTMKRVDENGRVLETVPRDQLRAVQTPQGFMTEEIRTLHQKALAESFQATDDAMLYEAFGHDIQVVAGESTNIKVTVPEDLDIAAQWLHART